MVNRRVMIAGNWKLHKTIEESQVFVTDLRRLVSRVRDRDIIIAPPFTALHSVASRLVGSRLELVAQDIFYEDQGAYTGAISGPLLKDVGCRYVLVGHSERRQLFAETLSSSNKRLKAALKAGLLPILCVGETLSERDAGRTGEVISGQILAALEGVSLEELGVIVVAYEPVWAIGSGKVATPSQAQQVHSMIREIFYATEPMVAENMRILYGGSVKPDNAATLLEQSDIDGVLVGGASLDAQSFAAIVSAGLS